jgi:uncharacterized membrane protein
MISLRQILVWVLWGLLAFTSVYLGLITFRYFSFQTNIGFLNAKQAFVHNTAWMTAFYIHISSSICVVLAGPFQFVKKLRNKYLNTHRTLGKLYVGAILALAAPSGFYMALYANGGLPAQLGFSVLCILWFGFTLLAYKRVRAGNITAHRKWMIRSYALSFSAVTLRLYTPILSAGFDVDDATVMAICAWINWVPNLLVAEIIITRTVK